MLLENLGDDYYNTNKLNNFNNIKYIAASIEEGGSIVECDDDLELLSDN